MQQLQLLDNVTSLAPVNRESHMLAQQAFQQVREALVELKQLKDLKDKVDD